MKQPTHIQEVVRKLGKAQGTEKTTSNRFPLNCHQLARVFPVENSRTLNIREANHLPAPKLAT